VSTSIILDCDPGIDDALAIAFATASPEIDLIGLTTVAGNVSLDKTTANALAVASFVGAKDVPVTPGAAAPLLRPALPAGHVHGEGGLGGAVLPPPARAAEGGHAIDYLIDTIGAARGEITLVATGPLTNVGLALSREPRLATWVRDFVIMGGSASRGNVNHAAEFNIWADPEAAAIVFRAGWTVRMIGLDVTLRAKATAAVQERMRELGALGEQLLLPALAQYRDAADDSGEPPVHDVCAIVSIADPAVFGYTPALVQVETTGTFTSGMTVTDFTPSAGHNTRVAMEVDADRFWTTVLDAYATLPVAGLRARWRKSPPPCGRATQPSLPGDRAPPTPGRGGKRPKAPLVASTRRGGSAAATIISYAWTACSSTSTRSR
jgi:purine nucleosidase